MAKTSPPQNNPPPFCIDCRHFIPEPPPNDKGVVTDVPRCNLSPMIEVVYGKKFFPPCIEMRGQNAPCGMAAKFFQSKKTAATEAEPPKLADN